MGLINSAVSASATRVSLHVDPREAVFAGHYPGHPILPGVFVIDAVCRAAPDLDLVCIESVRFTKPVVPGDDLVAELKWHDRLRCAAVVTVRDSEVARMTLRFEAGGPS